MIERIDVTTAGAVVPALLRPGIEAALAGRALGGGPEADVARAVAEAVQTQAGAAPSKRLGGGSC